MIEKLVLKASISKDVRDKFPDETKVLDGLISDKISPDDLLDITYSFQIEYLGRCEKVLGAFVRLMEKSDCVKDISVEEVTVSYCLIEKLFNNIKRIRDTLEGSKNA